MRILLLLDAVGAVASACCVVSARLTPKRAAPEAWGRSTISRCSSAGDLKPIEPIHCVLGVLEAKAIQG